MEDRMHEWLSLALRWVHVIAGIMWVGTTYLFNWMERVLDPKESSGDNSLGGFWMVHGGGFYKVEKLKEPADFSSTLHWFKYEALTTFISGFLLLIVVFYWGGLQVNFDASLSHAAGVGIGLGAILASFLFYNAYWWTKLGDNEAFGIVLSYFLLVALAWGLHEVLSPRAAYIHIGAALGTIMVTNVWMRILPNQRKMIAAKQRGEKPDMTLGVRGARCSRHNTYMSVPLIFTMFSSHYPSITYGTAHPWAVLALITLAGFAGAHWLRTRA
jgi:uncharacterized membrane protein